MGLQKVDFSKNITNVGDYAFAGCSNLKEVIFGENLIKINTGAFSSCRNLTKITTPISTIFGHNAFYENYNIKEVNLLLGTGVSANLNYGDSPSDNNYRNTPWYGKTINTIVVPEGVTSLGNYFFYYAQATNFVLPNTLKSIGTNTFYNATNTTNIIIPNTVTYIGSSAFYNVPHITYDGTASGSPWGAKSIN